MTPPADHYLTLLRALSDDEVSRWRHEHDRAHWKRQPDVQGRWWRIVEERSIPTSTTRASGTIEGR